MTALTTIVLLVCLQLLAAHACSNLWHAQVEHDIHQFKTTHGKVTRPSLDEAQTEILSGFRVLILNNTLYAVPQGWQAREAFVHTSRGAPHAALLLILKALCRHKFPDVEFVMNIQAERATSHALHSTAVFSYTKDSRNQRWDFLYPYWNVLWPNATRAQMAADSVPWEDKLSKAVWRGAPSNGALTPYGWQHTARTKLVMNCRQRPDLCDAGFYDYQKGRINDHETRRILKQEFGVSQKVSLPDHLHHKYLILVDGTTAPTSRTVTYMYSNSTILWQVTDLQEFFYTDLKPGVHYVPLNYHLSDLIDKLEWAKAHDDECRQIAQNAYEYATRFTDENIACYWKHLLSEYAALLNFKPQLSQEFARFKFAPPPNAFKYMLKRLEYPCTQEPWSTYTPSA